MPEPATIPPTVDPAPPPTNPASDGGSWTTLEALQRSALRALLALERCALTAFAEVSAQGTLLRRRERPVETLGERGLRLAAGQASLELLAQRTACAEDQGLDRGDRKVEDLADLAVRAALELAHDERGALVEAEVAERLTDLVGCRDGLVDGRCRGALVPDDLLGPPRQHAEPLPALVVRDLEQPVARKLGPVAALEGPEGVEERRLRDVLRVGRVPQHGEDVAVDVVHVARVEALERTVGLRPGEECGVAHCPCLMDASRTGSLR